MNYHIDKNAPEAAYLQLYRSIREAITDGSYRCGDRLPGKRAIAEDAGVSVITAEHALQLLADEGYIELRERSGSYVSFQPDEVFPVGDPAEVRPLPEDPEETEDPLPAVIPAEPFPFSVLARVMRRTLSIYGEKILVRSPAFGLPELRLAVAAYLGRSRGIRVSPEQILIGSGSEYFYGMLVQMLGRDRIYGLEDPSYPQIRKVYAANGAVCDFLKMGPDGIPSSELKRTKAGVLHVTPYHSYPTGVTASASRRHKYVEWARSRSAFLIEDDVDSEFTMSSKAEDTVFSLEPERTVFYLNTLTRTVAPSIRVAYLVLPSALAEEMKARVAFYSCSVPVYTQYLITELISGGEFERHINHVRRQLRSARQN